MNILQIVSGRGVNGALVYCKLLSEELASRGHQVTLLCRPTSWMQSHVDRRAVDVIESNLARFPLTELRRMAAFIGERNIDLVHTHMTRAQNFGIGLKLMTGVPVVATAHNRHFELHWNFNDYVIANSRSTFDYHARVNRIPGHRMETIYCCTDYDRFKDVPAAAVTRVRQRLRLESDDFLIGVIGEIAQRKGHWHLVRALPTIASQLPNLKVVFVGRFGRRQPHVRKIRNYLVNNGLAGVTKWVGRQSNVADYMAACELTVVPSVEEPLGLVAIESLMAGTPVVASCTGGLTEIIKHNQTGLLVPVGDEAAIAQAVVALANDSQFRNRLAMQGREHVFHTFSPKHLIDQVESVYNHLLQRKRAA